MNDAALTAALQLADSALPIGRHAHSYGLETILAADDRLDQERLSELIRVHVHESVAPLDGRALLLAHEAAAHAELDVLCALDRSVTAHKAVPGSRAASTACGRRLLRLGCELAPEAEDLHAYAARVEDGEADGNIAVVTGALAQALAVPARVALVIELRASAAALLTAAVRLGRLAATRAQVLLRRLDPDVAEAAAHCQATMRHPFTSTTPELDIAGLAHLRLAGRQFAS